MSDLHDGWYGIVDDGGSWRPVTDWEGRHCLAMMDARDSDEATHVGYFNGHDWEDVEPIDSEEWPKMNVGDRITMTGFKVQRPKWWQFWRKPVDPNGDYVITSRHP